MKKSLFVLILLISTSLLAQTELVFKPTVGTSKKITFKTDNIMTMTLGDKSFTMPVKADMFYTALVKKVETNGNVTIEYTLNKVYMKMTDPKTKKEMEYDSDKKQETEDYAKMDKKFRDKIGKTTTCVYDNKCKLISTEGEESNITEVWIKFPATKVKVNDTWEDSYSKKEGDIKIEGTTKYKVIEINKDQMVVESTTTGDIFSKPLKGIYYIDLKTGFQNFNSEGEMDMQIMKMQMKVDCSVE